LVILAILVGKRTQDLKITKITKITIISTP